MSRVLLLLALVLLTGCVASPDDGSPVPIAPLSQTSHVEGEVLLGSLMVGPYPFTFPVRAWGNGDITLQYPNKPHVIFSGDGGWIVEPIEPQQEALVRQAMARGDLLIPGGHLSPAGTIARSSR